MPERVFILLLCCLGSLWACDRPSPGAGADRLAPPAEHRSGAAGTVTTPAGTKDGNGKITPGPDTAPAASAPPHRPLDLSFDHVLMDEPERSGAVTAAETERLLPDLFDPKRSDPSLSVEGRLLTDQEAREFTDSLDGASVTIEIKTD